LVKVAVVISSSWISIVLPDFRCRTPNCAMLLKMIALDNSSGV
jgi:hypothetical protein